MKKNIGAGCGVIILDKNGRILLGRRNEDPEIADSELHEEGTWTLPGGNIEYGESFEEAGVREIKEECNLDVKTEDIEVICVQTDKNEHAHYVSVGMITRKYSGEIKVMEPNEITVWAWFDLSELPKEMFSPSLKTIICYSQNKFYID